MTEKEKLIGKDGTVYAVDARRARRGRSLRDARTRLQELLDSGEMEGLTQREIGERIGLSQARVSYLIKEMGIPYQRLRRGSPAQKRLQKLLDSGEAEGLTQKEIGERIGLSATRVSQLMRKMGISRR